MIALHYIDFRLFINTTTPMLNLESLETLCVCLHITVLFTHITYYMISSYYKTITSIYIQTGLIFS